MTTKQFGKLARQGIALSYSTDPRRISQSKTWTPPGMLFDLSLVALLVAFVMGSQLV